MFPNMRLLMGGVVVLLLVFSACLDPLKNPESKEYWFDKGVQLMDEGQYDKAINAFDRVLEIDPTVYTAWHNKGVILSREGSYNESLVCFNKAIELNSHDKTTWFNKGKSLDKLGREEDALEAYDRALDLDSYFYDALYDKGRILLELGRYNEAYEAYEKASKIKPKDKSVLAYKGVVLANLGRYNESIKALNTALEIDPHYDRAWCNKGIILTESGNIPDAINTFNTALEINPKNHCVWNKRMRLLYQLKQVQIVNYKFYENYSIEIPLGWWMFDEDMIERTAIFEESYFVNHFHGGDEEGPTFVSVLAVMKEETQDLHNNAQMYIDSLKDYRKNQSIDVIINNVNKTSIDRNDALIEEHTEILEKNERYGISALINCSLNNTLVFLCQSENKDKFIQYKPTIYYIINSIEC